MWKGSRAVYTTFIKLVQLQPKIQCHNVLAEVTIKGYGELYILRWVRLKRTKIFPILSSACARTNVILAGKSDSHQHSTTSFSENVTVVKTSYQMLEISSFSDQERALPPSTEISTYVLIFVLKKVQWSFPGCLFLENRCVVVLILKYKALKKGIPRINFQKHLLKSQKFP